MIRVLLPWRSLSDVPLWVFDYDVEGVIRDRESDGSLSVLVHVPRVTDLRLRLEALKT